MTGRNRSKSAAAAPPKNGPTHLTVAQYLTAQIELSPKTQLEIAKDAGLSTPNLITMLKQGRLKLPIAQIVPLAKALGVDPIHLYKMAMQEYQPETWEAIQAIINQPIVTANEMTIIEVIRQGSVTNPKIRTQEDRDRLLEAIATLRGDNDSE